MLHLCVFLYCTLGQCITMLTQRLVWRLYIFRMKLAKRVVGPVWRMYQTMADCGWLDNIDIRWRYYSEMLWLVDTPHQEYQECQRSSYLNCCISGFCPFMLQMQEKFQNLTRLCTQGATETLTASTIDIMFNIAAFDADVWGVVNAP